MPGLPVPGNLTQHEDGLLGWTEADWFRAMREGKRPDGGAIDPFMPWRLYARMTDDELRAMWLYFKGLPPMELGAGRRH